MTKPKNKTKADCGMYQVPWALREHDFHAALAHEYAKTDAVDNFLGLTDEDAEPQMEIENGIAVLTIEGVVANRLPAWMSVFFGYVSLDRIEDALTKIEDDPYIRGVVLSIDSPGGTVSGVPEIAETIKSFSKPVVAYTPGLIASAAYWIGSAATGGIVATKSALVGSVGVYLPVVSIRRYLEQAGVDVSLIKRGKYKGAMYPGTDLSDDQKADLQASVDYVYRLFSEHVLSMRETDPENLEGQDFYADQALDAGLVDYVGTLDDAIMSASRLADTGQNNNR